MTGGEGTWQGEMPVAQQLQGCLVWGRASDFQALEGTQEDLFGPGSRPCGSVKEQGGDERADRAGLERGPGKSRKLSALPPQACVPAIP